MIWSHRLRPHYQSWVWGSPPKGLDMFVTVFCPEKRHPRTGNGEVPVR